MKDLKSESLRSGSITLFAQGITTGLQLTMTVVLARLLTPDDYGVITMVLAVTAFAGLFKDLGLSAATIQRSSLSHSQVSTMFWANTAMGVLITLILLLSAPLIASFYQRPEVRDVTIALAGTFAISSVGIQHLALLKRDMRFGHIAVAAISSAAVTAAVAITLAAMGFRYWALVAGTLAGACTDSILLWILSAFRPAGPSFADGMKGILKFGAGVTGFDFVNYFSRNLDNVLIGRVWGAPTLGLYSRAYALLMFPISKLRGPLNAVAFPAMSKLQDEPETFRLYYSRLASILAFLSMPLAAYLFAGSDLVINVMLGEEWMEAGAIFSALAFTAFIQPVAGLRGLVLMSLGQSDRYFWWGVWNAIGVSIAFAIGVFWGALGVAVAYGVANYLILHPSLVYTFKNSPVVPSDLYRAIWRPALAAVLAGAATVYARTWIPDTLAIALAGTLMVFLLVYFGVILVLPGGRRLLGNYREYVRFVSPWGDSGQSGEKAN